MKRTGFEAAVPKKESAILVGIELFKKDPLPLKESLEELKRLVNTAGAKIAGTIYQRRKKPDPKFFVGTGKVEELKTLITKTQANVVIFDHELSPSQERNLEKALEIKIIDRTALILDIFAGHAHTKEGKIQVELAQAEFLLPRLTGHGVLLSRLGGGIGTRGPGETKLEVDRRRIRERISVLKKEIKRLQAERHLRRERRKAAQIKTIALIGYTNAGKSTLLNVLARSNVLVENKLFATLDPTTRRVYFPNGKTILLTDTVGFIQKLPHQLVDSFRATLEEVSEADLLLHIVDISHPSWKDQIGAVYTVLEELNCITKPIVTVFNKKDLLKKRPKKKLLEKFQPAALISAYKKEGLEKLLEIIAQFI